MEDITLVSGCRNLVLASPHTTLGEAVACATNFEPGSRPPKPIAMVEEYDSIIKNNAWEVVPRLEEKSVVGSRWIYKVMQAIDGSVEELKAKFVAKGFSQVEGIDYEETFSPVAR